MRRNDDQPRQPDRTVADHPAYNEERRISPTLARVTEYLETRRAPYEVIVVDDGSRDRTRELVRELAAKNPNVRLLALEQNSGIVCSTRYTVPNPPTAIASITL